MSCTETPTNAPLALSPHPSSPATAVRSLTARVERRPGALAVTYVLEGDLERLRIPAPAAPRMDWTLWQHTCFEVFLAAADSAAYHEFNFSPSGEWGAFAFQRYREGSILDDPALAPDIAVERGANRLELRATVPLAALSPALREAPLRIGLTAVIEAADGSQSYWALRHAGERPDFHHSDSFVLPLSRSLGEGAGG